MTIYKNSYDNRLYLVYKVSPPKMTGSYFVCEDYYTKETYNMTDGGRYSFKTLKQIATTTTESPLK